MKLSTLFIINTVVAILFGLGFVLIPVQLLSFYAVELNDQGLFIARLLGSAFLGFGIITWLLRNAIGSPEVKAILLAYAISDLLGFLLSLIYQLQGVANSFGWTTVAIYLLLGLAFAYMYWKH